MVVAATRVWGPFVDWSEEMSLGFSGTGSLRGYRKGGYGVGPAGAVLVVVVVMVVGLGVGVRVAVGVTVAFVVGVTSRWCRVRADIFSMQNLAGCK